ncbi:MULTISPECIES: Sec-independent protein translocase protein TatB [Brucella/Ochrobactrum group]|uniref:Sec-independent protein translocase protein TatB n=1 Tax=Brucella pseudintermedia TaxID=370111 RepID=A0ABY5UBA6_9HYPH|nr:MULTISPECIES: Sec-independent protein translocase protein TatB [Brucella/Ochrobactrum group]KAB2680737.1 twin-arginine translocase subunit TatB [Brucella pseudintermedia]MCO7725870.1 Sec-independent protein translocase protein TatB [Brucella intermedia]NKE77377.1 twin-arginine translocase subunit TatB [Ochrobactrum sp. MC-1LL]UWL60591.1 Sec-independent protein translocase protein TatB [Brucella pseudintermedia]WPM81458.1 Sec-independent protein translocase protein TatB [Brucella pseudinterm
MFDIGWSELLIIAIVMIVVVGPKDLPKMLRAFGKATARMRATANEFKQQFDEALKEAELDDVKTIIDETRKLDPRSKITQVFDPIRSAGEDLRAGLQSTSSMSPATPEKIAEVTTPVDAGGAPVPPAVEPAAEQAPAPKKPARKAAPKAGNKAKEAKAAPVAKPASRKSASTKSETAKAAAAAPAKKTTKKTGTKA